MGYTQAEVASPTATTKWNQGGVLRLITKEDLNGITFAGTALNPYNWEVSSVLSGIGPVTSSIAHLAHYPVKATSPDKSFLYFGTGRYFYSIPDASDDTTTQRKIFGVKELCLPNIILNQSCTSAGTVATGDLAEAATADGVELENPLLPKSGWYINLSAAAGSLYAERIITDPLASTTGAIFFTSFAPTTDACSFGGKSYLWAVKYDTGGAIGGYIKGIGLLQLSTGAIEEINLGVDLTDREGRRTAEMQGVPPTGQGLSLVVPPKPLNKVMHIRKK